MVGVTVKTESRAFSFQRDRAGGTVDGVVEVNAAIFEEPGQTFPARKGAPDRLGEFALCLIKPGLCAVHARIGDRRFAVHFIAR